MPNILLKNPRDWEQVNHGMQMVMHDPRGIARAAAAGVMHPLPRQHRIVLGDNGFSAIGSGFLGGRCLWALGVGRRGGSRSRRGGCAGHRGGLGAGSQTQQGEQ